MHNLVAVLATAIALAAPVQAQADQRSLGRPGVGPVIFDILVLRPLGFAAAAAGAVAFVPAAILTAPMGMDAIGEAWEHLVEIPTDHVFDRPLGDF